MWTRISAKLKGVIDSNATRRQALLQGDIVLQRLLEEDGNRIVALSTHIPLMYLRPWHPTFALLEEVESESNDQRRAFR